MSKKDDVIQAAMRRYADHFTLQWDDDVSMWEEDIPRPTGGGAFLPSPYPTPPDLYMSYENAADAPRPGPWVFISYRDDRMPRDMFHVVTLKQLQDAIAKNDPLHNPEMTTWAEKNAWKRG